MLFLVIYLSVIEVNFWRYHVLKIDAILRFELRCLQPCPINGWALSRQQLCLVDGLELLSFVWLVHLDDVLARLEREPFLILMMRYLRVHEQFWLQLLSVNLGLRF